MDQEFAEPSESGWAAIQQSEAGEVESTEDATDAESATDGEGADDAPEAPSESGWAAD